MPFTKTKCGTCGKEAESQRQFEVNDKSVHLLKCGHLLWQKHLEARDIENLISLDGKRPFAFQTAGVRFVEKSGGRALIADEMGLGKTVQALCTIALHPEMQPCAYIVKSSLKIQWMHEIMRWVSSSNRPEDLALPQVIDTSRDMMLPGVKHYLFSFDILRRFNGSLVEAFQKRGIKTVVVDECQQIKNPASTRTREVRDLCRVVPNVIALSGTPIKNNAGEYFPVLNILKPEIYPKLSRFLYNECDSYNNGGWGTKTGGLKNPAAFMDKTKSFIIRRERKEVLPDLPTIDRRFHFDALGKEVEDAYRAAFIEFRDDYFTGGKSNFADNSCTIAYLSRMRHLTGLSKVNPCVEFIEEFLLETDRKIVIFLHHIDVSEILERKIRSKIQELSSDKELEFDCAAPLMLSASVQGLDRDRMIEKFKNDPRCRIMIASTLSSGEGLNLQFAHDCIILERQWNPANEEQAECRFIRIGQESDQVTATYFVAVGTVDEFFAKIVEEKREIVTKTMGGVAVKWDQSSLMKELAEVLATSGGRMWGL